MRIVSNNMNDLWMESIEDIFREGDNVASRVGDSRELIGGSFSLTDITRNLLTVPGRKFSSVYAAAELLWYLSGSKNGDMMKFYAPRYANFLNDGYAHGAYGHRWFRILNPHMKCQIRSLIHHLRGNETTRQGVLSCWFPDDIVYVEQGKMKDIPCTLNLQFIPRRGELHLVTTMRSNDFWLGFPYDVWCFTSLQKLIADELGLNYGTYIHNVGSAHIYKTNYEKVEECLSSSVDSGSPSIQFSRSLTLMHDMSVYPEVERQLRETDKQWEADAFLTGTLLDQCLALCWNKIGNCPPVLLDNIPVEMRS